MPFRFGVPGAPPRLRILEGFGELVKLAPDFSPPVTQVSRASPFLFLCLEWMTPSAVRTRVMTVLML